MKGVLACRTLAVHSGMDLDDGIMQEPHKHATPLDVSIKGYIDVVERVVKEKEAFNGKMVNFDGTVLPW